MKSLTNKIDLQRYTKQYSGWLKSISELLDFASIGMQKKHFFDFGCGVGHYAIVASKSFSQATGADFKFQVEEGQSLAKVNDIQNLSFIQLNTGISDLTRRTIEPINLFICIMVIELIPSKDVIELFKFASEKLEKNGRFLIVTRRRVGFFRTLLTFERFRYDSFFRAIRVMIGLSRAFLVSLFSNQIKPSIRPRFYHNKSEILNLAKKNNFKLYKSPSELAKLDCVQSLETQITPEQFLGLRQANWFIFEKNAEAK